MQYARTNRFIFPIGISLCIIEPHIPALVMLGKLCIPLDLGPSSNP